MRGVHDAEHTDVEVLGVGRSRGWDVVCYLGERCGPVGGPETNGAGGELAVNVSLWWTIEQRILTSMS